MNLPVAVLAGGLATRVGPITERVPKSLVEVAGKPFVAHQFELLVRNGITDVVFLVSHFAEQIQQAVGDGSRWGVRARFVCDGPERLGTGGAIRHALSELGGAFFVLYGDSYLPCDYQTIAQAFPDSSRSGLMTVFRNDDLLDRSNVLYEDGRILRYDKQNRTADMRHIDYGLGVFRRSAFELRPPDVPFDLALVYHDLLARGDLAAYEVPTRFYEIGSVGGLADTAAYLAAQHDERNQT